MKVEKIRVSPTSFASLMMDIQEGRIRIPRFQRDFIWERRRIQELLDSMYREFPIGTIFLWEAPSKYNHLLRTVEYLEQPPVEPDKSYSLILDGQQRLTSLYVVTRGLSIDNGENYEKIVVDLSKNETDGRIFHYREPDNKRWVSVRTILDNDFEVYNNLPSDEYKQKFARCHNLLRNYPFSLVTVRDMEIDEAIEIFERINRLGRRLTRYDLITASVLTDEFDLRERTEQDIIAPLRTDFGEIPETSIPQALALNIRGNTGHSTQLDLKATEIQHVWDATVESFKLAADFVRRNLGVERADFLPYDAMLPVLQYYFFYTKTRAVKSPEHRRQLERWFWRVAFSERYSGSSQTRMTEDAGWIRKLVDEEQMYGIPITITIGTLIESSMSYTTSAVRNGILCLLHSQKPLHFKNGSPVQIKGKHFSKFTQAEKHHIFPVEFLRRQGYKTKRVHLIPNFCFIPAELHRWISNKTPSQYMGEIRDTLEEELFEQVMRSHLIPVGENSGIWTDDYERFLRQRAELLIREIRQRCGASNNITEENRNPIIDAIESALRDTIHQQLSNRHGVNYWKQYVPGDVKQKIEQRIDTHVSKTPGTSKGQFKDSRIRLDFCDISEYVKLILNQKNWPAFSAIFRNKRDLERVLDDFREFRNAVKHNRKIDTLIEHRAQAAIIWLVRALDLDLSEYDIYTD